jgi:ADP-ribose pyrophosphatase YjhB (NUDIX family)
MKYIYKIMRKIKREIVSALIFSGGGKIFLGKKDMKTGGVYCDCWHIPGGGIEDGENKRDALIR